jgi:hypothetical protein
MSPEKFKYTKHIFQHNRDGRKKLSAKTRLHPYHTRAFFSPRIGEEVFYLCVCHTRAGGVSLCGGLPIKFSKRVWKNHILMMSKTRKKFVRGVEFINFHLKNLKQFFSSLVISSSIILACFLRHFKCTFRRFNRSFNFFSLSSSTKSLNDV